MIQSGEAGSGTGLSNLKMSKSMTEIKVQKRSMSVRRRELSARLSSEVICKLIFDKMVDESTTLTAYETYLDKNKEK